MQLYDFFILQDGYLSVAEIEAEFDVFVDSSLTDYGHLVHDEL